MNIEKAIGKYLRDNGVKQNHVCEKTGLSQDALSRICNGNRKMTASEFLLICNVLDVDPRTFATAKD